VTWGEWKCQLLLLCLCIKNEPFRVSIRRTAHLIQSNRWPHLCTNSATGSGTYVHALRTRPVGNNAWPSTEFARLQAGHWLSNAPFDPTWPLINNPRGGREGSFGCHWLMPYGKVRLPIMKGFQAC